MAWDWVKISGNFWNGPKCAFAILYYIFMWSNFLSTDNLKKKSKYWSILKNAKDALHPVVPNFQPGFHSLFNLFLKIDLFYVCVLLVSIYVQYMLPGACGG